jgi:hypothetical protein
MRVTIIAHSLTAVAGSLLIGGSGACSPAAHLARPAAPQPTSFVEVTNSNWLDVVVYRVRSGVRWRLGTVRGLSTATFHIPRQDVLSGGGLRLMADPIGSREVYMSERIVVAPGQRVELTVAPRLSHSYFAVR